LNLNLFGTNKYTIIVMTRYFNIDLLVMRSKGNNI